MNVDREKISSIGHDLSGLNSAEMMQVISGLYGENSTISNKMWKEEDAEVLIDLKYTLIHRMLELSGRYKLSHVTTFTINTGGMDLN